MNTKIIIGISCFIITIVLIIVFTRKKDNRYEVEINKLAPDTTSRFIVAAPNGELKLSNKSVRNFSTAINSRDMELINDYIRRDTNFWTKAQINSTVRNLRAADTSQKRKINELIQRVNDNRSHLHQFFNGYFGAHGGNPAMPGGAQLWMNGINNFKGGLLAKM